MATKKTPTDDERRAELQAATEAQSLEIAALNLPLQNRIADLAATAATALEEAAILAEKVIGGAASARLAASAAKAAVSLKTVAAKGAERAQAIVGDA